MNEGQIARRSELLGQCSALARDLWGGPVQIDYEADRGVQRYTFSSTTCRRGYQVQAYGEEDPEDLRFKALLGIRLVLAGAVSDLGVSEPRDSESSLYSECQELASQIRPEYICSFDRRVKSPRACIHGTIIGQSLKKRGYAVTAIEGEAVDSLRGLLRILEHEKEIARFLRRPSRSLSAVLDELTAIEDADYPLIRSAHGTFSKIQEEFAELEAAHNQGVRILELCEMADLYGAMRGYLEQNFAVSIEDLMAMWDATTRADEKE